MPTKILRAALCAIALTLAAVVAPAGIAAPVAASSAAPSYTNASQTYESHVLYYTNLARKRHGVRPLSASAPCVDGYAEAWGRHLAVLNAFYHQSLTPILNTCGARAVAENLGKGNVTAQRMVAMWMASPDHRRNLLNPRYSRIGIAGVYSNGGTLYTVQDFRN